MLDILLLAVLGCFLGAITGLTPGLHVNTVAVMGLCVFPSFSINPLQFAVVMTAMAVTHTFLDFIPAIFLGVPEEETALSILPTHQLLLQGNALEAIKLTALGSLLGLFFALLLLAPTLILVPIIYERLRGFIVYLLILAVFLLILREKSKKNKLWALTVFLISGYLGIVMFDLKMLSSTQALFPVFVGLFGLSNLLFSLRFESARIPQEQFISLKIKPGHIYSGFWGALAGLFVGVLPAMSPSQLGILMYSIIGSDIGSFLVSISAINTSDAIFSLVSLYTINNPRSGVATMIGKVLDLNFNNLMLLIGAAAFSAVFATILHIEIGKRAMNWVGRINYKKLSTGSLLLVLALVYLITGWFGILVALLATCIGLLPILSGVSRTHCMGVLLLPTILYFLGFNL